MLKKILILSTGRGYGGAEKSIELLAKELSNFHNVTICVSNKKHIEYIKQIKNISIVEFKNSRFLWIYNIIYIILHLNNFDIIISNTNKDAFCLSIVNRFINFGAKEVLVYIRDYQWKYKKFIFKSLKNVKYLIPTKAILDNQELKNFLNNKVFFDIGEPIILDKSSEYVEGTYILLLANIARWKGIDLLIEAYLNSELPKRNINLLICGKIIDDKFYQKLLSMIDARYIKIYDFCNDQKVAMLYKNSLFVVNTSINKYGGPETFGRTIIEAWAHKKAVVAFNIGGPKYIIKDKKNGILVEEENIEKLRDSLNLLLNNKSFCKELALNGYKEVKRFYNLKYIAKKLLKIAKVDNRNRST